LLVPLLLFLVPLLLLLLVPLLLLCVCLKLVPHCHCMPQLIVQCLPALRELLHSLLLQQMHPCQLL
jgi:hypothetical protein